MRKVFVNLYQKGLIYRGGNYIINWDPKARTALSDIEVIHKDVKGAFYHVKYPFADGTTFNGKNYIEIATTRPETMMGDVAVAVHPSDKRYQELVGKMLVLPLQGRHIPIIADEYVDPEFGTGMVKITPAHDPNDFGVGNRHDLERINTMNEDATMNENAGKYEGMDRFEARKAIVKDLEDGDYMLKIEPIVHSVGHSERTGGVQVEARLSTQWFVKMKPLAEAALKNQKTAARVDFVPERFEHTFTQWMDNIHDWVISRQLWWGGIRFQLGIIKRLGGKSMLVKKLLQILKIGSKIQMCWIPGFQVRSGHFLQWGGGLMKMHLISSAISQLIRWSQGMILSSSGSHA